MDTKIQISVCIMTFNSEGYILNAIQSVVNQNTNFRYEIILADDGSTDNTVGIIESNFRASNFKDFKLLKSDFNQGVNTNLMSAFKECRGKYIALLDADDIWTDLNKLQIQFDLLSANKQIDYTYTNYLYSYSPNKPGDTLGLPENFKHPATDPYEYFLINPYICICTICFKRELLDFGLLKGFVSRNFISQDYPLLLFFSKNYKGWYLPVATTLIILKQNSISRPSSLQKKLEYFKNIHVIGDYFISLYGAEKETIKIRNFKYHFKYLLALWLSSDFSKIKNYSKNLKFFDFIKFQPKSLYILYASKNIFLYKLLRPWVLRKRPPGK